MGERGRTMVPERAHSRIPKGRTSLRKGVASAALAGHLDDDACGRDVDDAGHGIARRKQ